MNSKIRSLQLVGVLVILVLFHTTQSMSVHEKRTLKNQVLEMFDHAYTSYMNHAYPADEIMPISCKGRYRGITKSRGDIDEVLGNYSLTLIDSLDTLALLNKVDEFELAVQNVISQVHFDRDIIISVFETNIRILGGLLGGHVSLLYLREKRYPTKFNWYNNELLLKAKDLADRLLPAFNTNSGLPMSRVNLKFGLTNDIIYNEKDRFTCTACAGTLLLEFATLSRLTGNEIYETKARQALQILWDKRNRGSDLVGTVINVEDGEWAVKDSNIGAGIDSYYEYLFKGYVLLGDDELLNRFNQHYDSLVKFNTLSANDGMSIGDGGFMKTVSMHQPNRQSKSYIDSLLAFWPGLQVLKGDIKGAIKMHATLNEIVKRHDFLPEAVLFDHSAHWVGHPLRPEFLESTYYLYKATNDHYYLDIAKRALNQLEMHSRSECGYAAISDVRTKKKEDRMDSFVFAETFKYFFLIFSEDDDLVFDLDEFVFTTEAHLLPVDIPDAHKDRLSKRGRSQKTEQWRDRSCPSLGGLFQVGAGVGKGIKEFRESVVLKSKKACEKKTQFLDDVVDLGIAKSSRNMPLKASEFVAGRKDHMQILNKMGIQLTTMEDGRVQLVHKTHLAESLEDAETGILFMAEMLELSKQQDFHLKSKNFHDEYSPMSVVAMKNETDKHKELHAGPAQFGYDLKTGLGVFGRLVMANPPNACTHLDSKGESLADKIVVAKRGDCIFIDKARNVQKAGGLGLIIVDNVEGSSFSSTVLFSMSGDGKQDVVIPSIFLFSKEGNDLLWDMRSNKETIFFMGNNLIKDKNRMSGAEAAINFNPQQFKQVLLASKNCTIPKFIDFIASLEKNLVCNVDDLNLLLPYFNIFTPLKPSFVNVPEVDVNSDDNVFDLDDNESVFVFDDSVQLVYSSETDRYLDIKLEILTGLENDAKVDDAGYARSIFELLYNRLEMSTNILELNNRDVYSKALFKYVVSKLNPSNANFTDHDRTFLKLLAREIGFNSDNGLRIMTRKKVKRNEDAFDAN